MEKTPVYTLEKLPLYEDQQISLQPELGGWKQPLPPMEMNIPGVDLSRGVPGGYLGAEQSAPFPAYSQYSERGPIMLPDMSTQESVRGIALPEEKQGFNWPMALYGLGSALGTGLTMEKSPYIAAGIGQGYAQGMQRWTDIQQERERMKEAKRQFNIEQSYKELQLQRDEEKAKAEAEELQRKRNIETQERAVTLPYTQEIPGIPFPAMIPQGGITALTPQMVLPPPMEVTGEIPAWEVQQRIKSLPEKAQLQELKRMGLYRPELAEETLPTTEAQFNAQIENDLMGANPGMTRLKARIERTKAEAETKKITDTKAPDFKETLVQKLIDKGLLSTTELKEYVGARIKPPAEATPPTPTDADDYVVEMAAEYKRSVGSSPTPGMKAQWRKEYRRAGVGEREQIQTMEKAVEKAATRLEKLEEKADFALKSMEVIQRGKELVDQGIYAGAAANIKLGFSKWIQEAGITIGEQRATNTDTFASLMGKQVGQVIKDFGSGTGLSDADREYAEKIAGGKITLTEGAIKNLLDIGERLAKWDVTHYNQAVANYNKGIYFEEKAIPKGRPKAEEILQNLDPDLVQSILNAQKAIQQGKDKDQVYQRLLGTFPNAGQVIREQLRGY